MSVGLAVSVHWFIGSLVHWYIGTLVHWFIGSSVRLGSSVHRYVLFHRFIGTSWFIGSLVSVYRCIIGISLYRCIGVVWRIGVSWYR